MHAHKKQAEDSVWPCSPYSQISLEGKFNNNFELAKPVLQSSKFMTGPIKMLLFLIIMCHTPLKSSWGIRTTFRLGQSYFLLPYDYEPLFQRN